MLVPFDYHMQLEPAALGDRLRSEVVGRAACRVRRQLHFQALSGSQPSADTDSPAAGLQAAGGAGTAACQAGGDAARRQQCSSELLDCEVLREVEAARQACKRDIIKRQLQAQLPGCVVSTAGFCQLCALACGSVTANCWC